MKVFLRWWLRSIVILIFGVGISLIGEGPVKGSILPILLIFIIGSLLLAALFSFFELKVIPKRKARSLEKVIDLFSAYPVSDKITHFRTGGFDVYTEFETEFILTLHGHYLEQIIFHIPREQIDSHAVKPTFRLVESYCNGIPTYFVYKANTSRLAHWKKKFEKRMDELGPRKNPMRYE